MTARQLRVIFRLFQIALVTAVIFVGWMGIRAIPRPYWGKALQSASYAYPLDWTPACSGTAVQDTQNQNALPTVIRTPLNYEPTYPHPLLMVYAPSGIGSRMVEQFTGLTHQATALGFIVAYAESIPLNTDGIAELGRLPEKISRRWCIDRNRVYLSGHSDGGTVSMALAFMAESPLHPAAIAPSSAGISGEDLEAYACPQPVPVMVFHNKGDRLFPDFGAQTSRWWARCNHCAGEPIVDAQGCLRYQDCSSPVRYCELSGGHLRWPRRNQTMLSFFASQKPAPDQVP